MPGLVPSISEAEMLAIILNKSIPQDLELRLFKNDVDPQTSHNDADYIEADFIGYSSIVIPESEWKITAGVPSFAIGAQQIFMASRDQPQQDIFGFYLVKSLDGTLMWAERFWNGPYQMANNEDKISIIPRFTFRSQVDS